MLKRGFRRLHLGNDGILEDEFYGIVKAEITRKGLKNKLKW